MLKIGNNHLCNGYGREIRRRNYNCNYYDKYISFGVKRSLINKEVYHKLKSIERRLAKENF